MPNHLLKPLTPLGNAEPVTETFGTITVCEIVTHELASIAQRKGHSTNFKKAARKTFGVPLAKPSTFEHANDKMLMWTAPDQWMFEAPTSAHEDSATILKTAFDKTASITEQSGAWCRFDLAGDMSVDALQRLCALDTANMKSGSATRTIMEHIGVYVACRAHLQKFSIYGPRSSAASLYHALTTAAKSVA